MTTIALSLLKSVAKRNYMKESEFSIARHKVLWKCEHGYTHVVEFTIGGTATHECCEDKCCKEII